MKNGNQTLWSRQSRELLTVQFELEMKTSFLRYLIVRRKTLMVILTTKERIKMNPKAIANCKKLCLVVGKIMRERKVAKKFSQRQQTINSNRMFRRWKRRSSNQKQTNYPMSQTEVNSTKCRQTFEVCKIKLTTFNRNSKRLTTSKQAYQLTTKDHLCWTLSLKLIILKSSKRLASSTIIPNLLQSI